MPLYATGARETIKSNTNKKLNIINKKKKEKKTESIASLIDIKQNSLEYPADLIFLK